MFVTAQAKKMRVKCSDCSIEDFIKICEEETKAEEYPLASEVNQGVLIYEKSKLTFDDPEKLDALENEWALALMHGPGVIVVKGSIDKDVTDRVSKIYDHIVEVESSQGEKMKDHFSSGSNNIRVWNALEKLAVLDPKAYFDYYSNDVIATVSRCWLGPWYQITSQLNIVLPGCKAQQPHRDYHLGYWGGSLIEKFPINQHMVSPYITLQGAVSHIDMTVESGPTQILPHSHKYDLGYLAWRQEPFKEYFAKNFKQISLMTGDALFFNPALFHAAGENVSQDIRRCGNLLQVSNCMGRPMENVDRGRISSTIFQTLKEVKEQAGTRLIENIIEASAEGYPFPTNLDRDNAEEGALAPTTQADLLTKALAENWEQKRLDEGLKELAKKHESH